MQREVRDAKIALAVEDREVANPPVPMVILSTAHAAKFPDAVEAACGVRPALPAWLGDLMTRKETFDVMSADQNAVEQYVLARSRAAKMGARA